MDAAIGKLWEWGAIALLLEPSRSAAVLALVPVP